MTLTGRRRRRLRAGVVGVGHMGRYHVGVYAELFDVELVGVADIDAAKALQVAEQYGTIPHTDYRDLLGQIDVVSIAVPTALHYEIAKDFLEAGTHVLLEKPITRTLEQARALFDLAEARQLVLHVGHVERFNGAVQELKKIVVDPIFIESRRLGPFASRVQDDGVVMDLMTHDVDIILNLVDSKVCDMNVIGASVLSPLEDVANVQLCFENGCLATITASRTTQNKIRTLAVTQPDAYILLDYTDQDIRVYRQASSEHVLTKQALRYKQASIMERIFVHKENPLKLEIRHLIDCVTNGAKRLVSVGDELYAHEVVLSIVQQLERMKLNSTAGLSGGGGGGGQDRSDRWGG